MVQLYLGYLAYLSNICVCNKIIAQWDKAGIKKILLPVYKKV